MALNIILKIETNLNLITKKILPRQINGLALILVTTTLISCSSANQEVVKSENQLSVSEIAKELANPNTDKSTLTLNLAHTSFTGDLPKADKQDSFVMSFRPSFPFSLGDGKTFAVRPSIPFNYSRPVFDDGDFENESGALGDITTDIFLGQSYKSGWIFGRGAVFTLPTASNEALAGKSLNLGPEILLAKMTDWGVAGIHTTHQWDVAGWNDTRVSFSSLRYFYAYHLSDGWSIAAGPEMTYNWEGDSDNRFALPLGVGLTKTVIISGRPWRFSFETHYYVEQPEDIGPDITFRFKIAPVVRNPFSKYFK